MVIIECLLHHTFFQENNSTMLINKKTKFLFVSLYTNDKYQTDDNLINLD